MHSVPVSPHVRKQVGLGRCSVPEVYGYNYFIACNYYFTKWSETKPIRDKTALTLATFLYELICRHGCFEVQMNDPGREFINGLCTCWHDLTVIEQRITSAYHSELNGLVERQNRAIKNALVKVLNANSEEWPHIIEGVLFADCVSRHSSKKS